MQASRKRSNIYAVSILLGIALGWGGVLLGEFQYDDFPNILNDSATQMGPSLWERMAHGIRPLSRLTYAIDFALWGNEPRGWYITNITLHVLTAFGVWRLASYASLSVMGAWAAALIFALQPAHGAVIAYISGRSSGLMTALLVWALVAYEFGVRRPEFRRSARIVSILLFLAACAAKEVALIFPLLLLLWEFTKPNRVLQSRTLLLAVAPYLLAAFAIALYVISIARYRELVAYSISLRPPLESLMQNLSALPMTASLLARPWALSVEHAQWTPDYLVTFSSAGILVFCIAIAIVARRVRPMLTLLLLWPLFALLPTHSIIAKVDGISESPLYLAWVGPAIALGTAIGHWLAVPGGKLLRYTCFAFCVVTLSALCVWRTMVWSDPVRLWQEAVANAPRSSRAWNNLGLANLRNDNVDIARAAFRQAVQLDSTNVQAQFNLELTGLFSPTSKRGEK